MSKCVRGRVLGVLEIWVAFRLIRYNLRIGRKCRGGFWPIRDGVLTSNIGKGWSGDSGSKNSITSYRYFCRYIYFLSGFCFRSESETVFTPRPSRERDLVTMVQDGPAPGRVTTGVGSVSWGAGAKPNSPDRSLRPTLRLESDSMSITGKFTKRLLTMKNLRDYRSKEIRKRN